MMGKQGSTSNYDAFTSLTAGIKFSHGKLPSSTDSMMRKTTTKKQRLDDNGDDDDDKNNKKKTTNKLDVFSKITASLGLKHKLDPASSSSLSSSSKEKDVVVEEKPTISRNRLLSESSITSNNAESRNNHHSYQDEHSSNSDNDDDDDDYEQQRKMKQKKKKQQLKKKKEESDIQLLRKQMHIKIHGHTPPSLLTMFADLNTFIPEKQQKPVSQLVRTLLKNIENSKYKEPTPIQMQSIPAMLAGRDVLACAPTGSGKTASYLIPSLILLGGIHRTEPGIKVLVVVPTRELSAQILREFQKLSHGRSFRCAVLHKEPEVGGDSKLDIVFSTPLKLVHFIQRGFINLSSVRSLILDEADKLFEDGFLEQLDEIISACNHPEIQRSLWSATMPQKVEESAHTILRDMLRIKIGVSNAGASTIEQKLMFVGNEQGKLVAIRQLIAEGAIKPPAIFFVQSKDRAKDLHSELLFDGIKIDTMHSERTQHARDILVQNFREGKIWFLIASDILARGVDFKAVNTVVNVDFPTTAISYIHRIGRTGRAGRTGSAITLFTVEDMKYLRTIANVMRISGCEVPQWMLDMKGVSRSTKEHLQHVPPKRPNLKRKLPKN